MKKLLIICLLYCSISHLFAQENKKSFKYNHNFDLAISGGNGFSTALSWSHFHKIGKKGKFQLGYGVRLTSLFGNNVDHITAPAKLTTGNTGLGVIAQETITANLDTLIINTMQVNSLNLTINLQYAFTEKIEFGFNIDALGFSFGGEQRGTFYARSQGLTPSQETSKPTTANVLLTSDNDIGSLNSELYLRYWLSPKWAIRSGLTFAFSEYTTIRKLALDNDRFRAKILMPMIAVTFSPSR
ncbi:MAG: hypothetical protein MUE81_11075 [Thermoflexibacter sp.]|jgi:hypothetical protein|nr:hypothetical protein [Thermoflexibacter sp.]